MSAIVVHSSALPKPETIAISQLSDVASVTGTGSVVVMQASPTITTPVVAGFGVGSQCTNLGVAINAQTDDYQLVLGDAGKLVTMNKATANTLTIPANATVAFQVGDQVQIAAIGAGQTTVAAAGGVTVSSSGAKLKLTAQYSQAVLTKTATNIWLLSGELSA